MRLTSLFKRKKKPIERPAEDVQQNAPVDSPYSTSSSHYMEASSFPTGGSSYGSRQYTPVVSIRYDGEKTPGELGVIKRYYPDYRALRLRSYQAYAESDIVQAVVESHIDWVVGKGLRPQISPDRETLEEKGVGIDVEQFSRQVERQYKLYINSRKSIYDEETNLSLKMREVLRQTLLGGDSLVVLNVDEFNNLSVKCYDGEYVYSPMLGGEQQDARRRGNELSYGVEMEPSGKHVAYYLWDGTQHRRVLAYDPNTGMRMAYLVYSRKLRYDNTRGIPLIMAILESVKKMDRYKESMLAGAEERAKIAYQIVHREGSTEENPVIDSIRSALPLNERIDGAPNDRFNDGIKLQNKIASTTGRSVFNMPLESELKSLVSDVEFSFKDFFETNLLPLCAAVGTPVEVAMKKFENNFSSSRGALQMWGHSMNISRYDFSFHFNEPIYKTWLMLADIKGDINAPGLFESIAINNDFILYEAYTKIAFIGPAVPHVDPVKEAKAEREKLGPLGKNIPLTTPQEAATNLGGGDIDVIKENFEQQSEGFEVPEPVEDPEESTVMDIVTDEAV